jgi:hypothetical protein
MAKRKKIGRNDLCPCKSGKKYKKCCLDKASTPIDMSLPPEVKLEMERMQALQSQVEQQQGLGNPIISTVFKGYRLVTSGDRIYWDKEANWKTVHDFLFQFLKNALGISWGKAELGKPYEKRHPIIQWHNIMGEYLKRENKAGEDIQSAPMIGAVSAILNLAYNLFLLEHNVDVQKKLIKRLKSGDAGMFQGALYESYVAAIFIRAGFKLEMEDESDPDRKHCEFTAIASTGEKFSVEAKARLPFKSNVGVGTQLFNALKKDALHKRVVFIDLNVQELMGNMEEINNELLEKEKSLTIDGNPAPPAYVFITNHSFAYNLEATEFERIGFASGFKIDFFKTNTRYTSLREARLAREHHKDIVKLVQSMREQVSIPVTFDGEIPEFAFNEELKANRLLIGNKYRLPSTGGGEVIGVLESATLIPKERKSYGIYRLENGTRCTYTCPVTEEEVMAYETNKDTFFGVTRNQGSQTNDPLEFYDFIYNSYRETPRDKLLDFLKDYPNHDELKKMTTEELRVMFCENCVHSAMRDARFEATKESDRN